MADRSPSNLVSPSVWSQLPLPCVWQEPWRYFVKIFVKRKTSLKQLVCTVSFDFLLLLMMCFARWQVVFSGEYDYLLSVSTICRHWPFGSVYFGGQPRIRLLGGPAISSVIDYEPQVLFGGSLIISWIWHCHALIDRGKLNEWTICRRMMTLTF